MFNDNLMWAPVDVCGWAELSTALSIARGD